MKYTLKPPYRRAACLLWACLVTSGCQQQMAKQPSYRPLRGSSFFEDGRASRPPVEGTVARGRLRADGHLHYGLRPSGMDPTRAAAVVSSLGMGSPLTALTWAEHESPYADTFPLPITREVLDRGRERFEIFCSVCHGRVGDGKGMIPERGFTEPPSFHTDFSRGFARRGVKLRLRDAPVGYYFDVVTNGYGAMPDYAEQVPVEDRWAIIAYIRVLQYSQGATIDDVRDAKTRRDLLGDREGRR